MGGLLLLIVGVVVFLVGGVWTLQGLDLLGGTGGMNGSTIWAVIGPIVMLAGVYLFWRGLRRRRAA